MKRLLASSSVATIVVFGLFVVMTGLIHQEAPAKSIETYSMDNVWITELPDIEKPRPKPEEPKLEEKTQPEPVKTEQSRIKPKIDIVDSKMPTVEQFAMGRIPNPQNIFGVDPSQSGDSDANAITMIRPSYPPEAANKNLEGWVKLGYDITLAGRVANVRVIESKPRGVFERSARKALYRWKYKPSTVDGEAVASNGHVVTLEFNLEKE